MNILIDYPLRPHPLFCDGPGQCEYCGASDHYWSKCDSPLKTKYLDDAQIWQDKIKEIKTLNKTIRSEWATLIQEMLDPIIEAMGGKITFDDTFNDLIISVENDRP